MDFGHRVRERVRVVAGHKNGLLVSVSPSTGGSVDRRYAWEAEREQPKES